VDRRDDAPPVQPSATQAQPEAVVQDIEVLEVADVFGKSGEPKFRQLEPGWNAGFGTLTGCAGSGDSE
jgi:hypothetical protein